MWVCWRRSCEESKKTKDEPPDIHGSLCLIAPTRCWFYGAVSGEGLSVIRNNRSRCGRMPGKLLTTTENWCFFKILGSFCSSSNIKQNLSGVVDQHSCFPGFPSSSGFWPTLLKRSDDEVPEKKDFLSHKTRKTLFLFGGPISASPPGSEQENSICVCGGPSMRACDG